MDIAFRQRQRGRLRRIRVLISDVPQMVYELLRSEVESHADMEVAGPRTTRDDLMRDIAQRRPDVVILEPPATRNAEQCTRLLYSFPRAGAVIVSTDQRATHLYELRMSDTELGDMSPAQLVWKIHAQCRQVERDAEEGGA
jgi:DNA-binding NarL/FixJ family response regulator